MQKPFKIDISHNNICDGVVAFTECVKLSRTLKELNLSDNKITNYGITKIAEANSTSVKLDISHNNVSDDGAVAISKWLKTNNTLTKLDISWNKITDNGAVSIAKANRTLQKLDVSHNKISKNIVTVLGICLKYNNTLDELIISWNDIDTYISTTKCYVKAMWPLCISHNHTQHLVHTYNSASDKYLINTNNIYSLTDIEFDKSQFDDVQAILLTSLADGNVKKLK